MNATDIVKLLLEAIPDETLQIGQRLRVHQVGILNRAVIEAKRREIEVAEAAALYAAADAAQVSA